MEAKNPAVVCNALVSFLRAEMAARGFERCVLGLSGGIDSAVVARVAQLALCEESHHFCEVSPNAILSLENLPIVCVAMPSIHSSPQSLQDARECARAFGLPLVVAPLSGFESALSALYTGCEPAGLRLGNACARFRMALLFDIAFVQNRIVLGTSNKSERMLGYGTIFGDLASGINPLGNLYKTDVFALAKYLQIPQSVQQKPPSADLFDGQSDEADLGHSYALLDSILFDFLERGKNREQLLQSYDSRAVDDALRMYEKSRFKREPIPLAVV
ncbi:MAG: NAD(+) synthase [Helicobacter sp.]|nr:NAD(+) synthase [Helicobacter sp.]